MTLFSHLQQYRYGEVHVRLDETTGLRSIVAIHDTRLGPALGGCRFISYSSDEAALIDVLRLARGMTYKAALCGNPNGGGKAVILKPEGEFDRAALFRSYARFLNELGGRYITAEDSGTTMDDMELLKETTPHVTGVRPENGGSGDPSTFTALGVRRGIEACSKIALDRSDIQGLRVAIQGVGNVGYWLCHELHALGATLIVADIDPTRTQRVADEFGAQIVPLAQIFATECDVFSPCALGAGLNDQTIPQLACKIVAGAANNQLAEPRHGDMLMERGILYAPDYAINAGGIINIAEEAHGYDAEKARARTLTIYDTILEIATRAHQSSTPTHQVADRMVEERLAAAPGVPA